MGMTYAARVKVLERRDLDGADGPCQRLLNCSW